MKTELSQYEKIILWFIKNKDKTYFLPHDFMQDDLGECFVGYEASARLSELARDYPEMIDTEPRGRFKARRFMFDNTKEFLPKLPKDLRDFTKYHLSKRGIPFIVYETVGVDTPRGTVRLEKREVTINRPPLS